MKKVAFVMMVGSLPVPAIMGGGVETLLTMLVEQNEINPQFELFFLMPKTENIKKVTNNYKYTHICQIDVSNLEQKMSRYTFAFNWRTNFSLPLQMPYNIKVAKFIKKIQPDFVIYENGIDASVYKVNKLKKAPQTCLHVHNRFDIKKFYNKNIKNIIAVSNYIKTDWLKDCSTANVKVLPNAINEKYFQTNNLTQKQKIELRERFGIKPDDFVVLYTGRIAQEKGVLELVQAVADLKDENIKLLMIGSNFFGKITKTTLYQEQIKSIAVKGGNIIATGYIPYENLAQYYAIADVQVVPTLCEEASCMVAIEGNYCGLPQIVTNSGGMPENCSSSTIIIDKSGDVINQLKEAILKVKNEKIKNKKDIKALTAKDYYNEFVKVMKEFEREVCDDKNTKCKEE